MNVGVGESERSGGGSASRVLRGQHRCSANILYGVTTDEVNPSSTRDSASRKVPAAMHCRWVLEEFFSTSGQQRGDRQLVNSSREGL